ncbi:MAG TPA: acetyl-CoA C-acyltransferase [Candidatus Baltobacteraceae bacterium]|jgi:acetyl-CoA acetyltransferase family protein|nr:acetyl-CoA C-acyltransferase [Candidatus Baltobacteraceae bacterium]
MNEVLIVDAVRTPAGRRGGALANRHPVQLLALTLRALIDRTGIDPAAVDDVLAGCVSQVGEQALNIARNALLTAGFPHSVPGATIDRQCGSSQQAIAFASHAIAAGACDAAIACGVESMTRVALGSSWLHGPGVPAEHIQNQGLSAELVAKRWHMTREELDAYSLESHQRAAAAAERGYFDAHLLKLPELDRDEGVRPDTSIEKLGSLKPAFMEGGLITAGNSSQISDGAAAVLVASAQFVRRNNLKPIARIVADAVVGDDPELMLTAPIPATRRVLQRAGLQFEDIDLFEVNEAFASVVLAWMRELRAGHAKVNVNGGAIALGHPLGATGARLLAILAGELRRRGARYGLQVMCEGGGMANATIIERISETPPVRT